MFSTRLLVLAGVVIVAFMVGRKAIDAINQPTLLRN